MKFWLLTTEYPPFYGGGISTYCQFTAQMMMQKGHAVTVFINDASVESIHDEEINGIRIIRFNPDRINANAFLGHTSNVSYAFAQTIKQFIEQEGRPDIIEAQEYLGIAYFLLQYKLLLFDWCKDICIVVTAHSPAFLYLYYNHVPTYRYPDYWIGEMERFCLQAANLVISPSQYLLNAIKADFNFENNTIVIPNPLELPHKGNHFIAPDKNDRIIFYGKLSAQKGTFKLLSYFKQLWSEGFSEPLHLYGGNDIVYHPEGKTMGTLVQEQFKEFIQAGKLHLHSKIKPDEIQAQLSNAKLIIVPSTIDNLPYVVLEMMAQGNIVLVSRQGGQSEVITDGIDGFVFDHDEPQTFKEKLFKILMLTAEERKTIIDNAKRKITTVYNPKIIYEQKIAAILKALNQNKTATFPFIRQLQKPEETGFTDLQKGLLSVVVPYYNMGKYLSETIKSLQESLYNEIEIIIINDGSTDANSLLQLDKYRNKQGITILDIKNKGLANARNAGAIAAKGEFLAFLDADDTITPDYYTKAIKVLNHYSNVHFVGCWTQYFEGSSKIWPTFTPEPPIILYHNTVNSSALVYKREAFLQKGFNDTKMTFPGMEDYESVIALLRAGYRGIVLPETLFNYRVRTDSMIRGITRSKKIFLLQYISKKHQKFYANFAAEVTNLLQANGPSLTIDNPSLDYTLYSRYPMVNRLAAKAVSFVKTNPRIKKMALTIYRKLKS